LGSAIVGFRVEPWLKAERKDFVLGVWGVAIRERASLRVVDF